MAKDQGKKNFEFLERLRKRNNRSKGDNVSPAVRAGLGEAWREAGQESVKYALRLARDAEIDNSSRRRVPLFGPYNTFSTTQETDVRIASAEIPYCD